VMPPPTMTSPMISKIILRRLLFFLAMTVMNS
jgi:hypothetical protein